MKLYELNCLARLNSPLTQIDDFQEKLRKLIENEEGIFESRPRVKKKIIYLKKGAAKEEGNSAYLISVNFILDPVRLEKLKENLSKENEIIRYLIVKKKPQVIKEKRRLIPLTSFKEVKKEKRKKLELEEIGEKLEEILSE